MSEAKEEQFAVAVKEKRKKATSAYPKYTLKECIRIAQAIEDKNAGQPYSRLDIGIALDLAPEGSTFRTMITGSTKYGITEGGYQAEKLSLTALGTSIVTPMSEEEKNASIVQALQNVEVFKKFFDRFNLKKLPEDHLLKNTISREFGIPPGDAEGCLAILKKNLEDWGIVIDIKGNKWVRLDKLSGTATNGGTPAAQSTLVPQEEEEEEVAEEPETATVKTPNPMNVPAPAITAPNNSVFISHSKNKVVLEQIKTILKFGHYEPVVAVETETTSIPIPEKVFGLMKDCSAAIINISADESEKKADGTYGVNPNVLIEIGGAFLLYNKKVILLADKRVVIPSNLRGLALCEYEGDELSWNTGMKLQTALLSFRSVN